MQIKLPKTFEEQLQILSDRGCYIHDHDECLDTLKRINYYRFTGYLIPYKENDGNYKPGTSFSKLLVYMSLMVKCAGSYSVLLMTLRSA